eukprot:263360-Rhodomonas_salina.8
MAPAESLLTEARESWKTWDDRRAVSSRQSAHCARRGRPQRVPAKSHPSRCRSKSAGLLTRFETQWGE